MTVKSIIDIDINDERFKKFQELFEKYKVGVENLPDSWKGVNKELIAAALHVKDITLSIMKWASLTGVVGGLLGGGGLFGLDVLAANVGATRRTSLGLGTTYGEQKAFEIDYNRVLDAGSFLSGVNSALHDVTRRYTLYAAGLNEGEIRGKDTAQVSIALIKHLKSLADRTPEALLSQVMQSRGLDQFLTLQEFQRLRATPASELAEYAKNFGGDVSKMGLTPNNQKAWQDFQIQMQRAGAKIENVFVKGLSEAKIPEALNRLSDAVAISIETFLKSGQVKILFDKIGRGIKSFANYISRPQFQKDIETFVTDIGLIAKAIVDAMKFFGVIPRPEPEKEEILKNIAFARGSPVWTPTGFGEWIAKHTMGKQLLDYMNPFGSMPEPSSKSNQQSFSYPLPTGTAGSSSLNNPGNMRPPNKTTGFMHYATIEDGLRAMARQLLRYEDKYHLDTIADIVSRWAPPSENDTAAYIKDVSNRTGFLATRHLDLHNKEQLASLISAMAKHENKKNNYTPEFVVKVLNNTGGSAVVTSSQNAWVN